MPPTLEPQTRIGSYELVRQIGVGGMAEVWAARRVSERRANKYVAIKVVAGPHVGDPRFQRMFKAEVELSALLNHVNIVQVFDEGEDDGRSYLVMEWVDGCNLVKVGSALTFVDDESFRLEVIAYVIGQLLYALKYAHSITLHDGNPLGIVHRDVTPHNVLVSVQGEVKLTDFGVAHHVLDESSGVHVKGKLRYMAPEQLAGRTRDPRIDLYAVGAILHELLDGRRFRHGVEDQRVMYGQVLSGTIPELLQAVPPELDAVRLGLLEPNPQRRFRTADVALDHLIRFGGYGDSRRKLAQLCAGITGVMKPRVGPGTSRLVPAAVVPSAAAAPSAVPQGATPEITLVGSKTERLDIEGIGGPVEPPLRMEATHEQSLANPPPTEDTERKVGVAPGFGGGAAPSAVGTERLERASSPAAERASSRSSTPGDERVEPPPRMVATAPRARAVVPWVLLAGVAGLAGGWVSWWLGSHQPGPVAVMEPMLERAPPSAPTVTVALPMAGAAAVSDLEHGSTDTGDASDAGTATDTTTGITGDSELGSTGDTSGGSTGRSDGPADASTGGQPSQPSPKARPKQALSVVAAKTLGVVQVDVRSTDGELRRKYELSGHHKGERIATGSYWVKWRRKGDAQWSPRTRVVLRRGCDLRIVLGPGGINPISMGSGCR